MERTLAIFVLLALVSCGRFQYTPDPKWAKYRDSPESCLLHEGEQSQQYADRLLSVCEELRKPDQRVYMYVFSEQQGQELLESCYFGCPPPYKEVRGFYGGFKGFVDAHEIAINETVLRDGAERSLIQHELCHTRDFRGDPVCDVHEH